MLETSIDRTALLKNFLTSTNDTNQLGVLYAARAAVYTTGSKYLETLILEAFSEPSPLQKRDIEFAVARMGVTTPYFVARQHINLAAVGSLEALNFTPFSIDNELTYHHACVAISLINSGHMCLRSHIELTATYE